MISRYETLGNGNMKRKTEYFPLSYFSGMDNFAMTYRLHQCTRIVEMFLKKHRVSRDNNGNIEQGVRKAYY